MTGSADESEILDIATTAISSVSSCWAEGVHLDDDWRLVESGVFAVVSLGQILSDLYAFFSSYNHERATSCSSTANVTTRGMGPSIPGQFP